MREQKIYYRYMSEKEAGVVEEEGLLRGGLPGETYWTDERYGTAAEAKSRLALKALPEVRLAFTIKNDPALEREGTRVGALDDEPGGGMEWMTTEKVEVEVIGVDKLE